MFVCLQEEIDLVTISGYQDVPENDEESLLKALAQQPLSVAIEASSKDFQFYSGVSWMILIYHIHFTPADMTYFK
jgi:hypothetical protein